MLSEKQWQVFCFGETKYDALVCEGAVRSGKTSIMSVAFFDWAMEHFDRCAFIIAGVSVETAKRNIVNPAMGTQYITSRYTLRWTGKANCLTVSGGGRENLFYVFGGKDEASYRTVQGLTAAGCLLDEVVLMPRSFVEQCLARCSVDGSKFWFSCNPGAPSHWFYKEWVKGAAEKNAYRIHFLLRDNPGLTEPIIKRYESQYTGVFHDRYIKGLWVAAEGMVYPNYREGLEETWKPTEEKPAIKECISIDYGTLNPFAALKWLKDSEGVWHCVGEYYYSGREKGVQKTDGQYADDMDKFTAGMEKPVQIIIDPSAASMIAELRKRGYKVRKANNDVVPGIKHTMNCIHTGAIKVSSECARTIEEFESYVWDDKSEDDKPIKENDHAMDAMRYFVMTERAYRKKETYVSPFERRVLV